MKRRHFIKTTVGAGVAAATFGNMFDPFSVKAYANAPLLAKLAQAAGSGRVLVVVQLDGGNDGLNTVIPRQDSAYFNSRPSLAINNSLALNDTLGWHPSLAPFQTMHSNGEMALIQNVGYSNPNRSHFRSTDIWFTGSDANTVLYDGWLGRYLEMQNPDYPDTAPDHPLALQIGVTSSLMLQGPDAGMGMAINDPETFYKIVDATDISGGDPPNLSTPGGIELDYIRRTTLTADKYATPIRDAAGKAQNNDVYPSGKNVVADQLKIVARMIAGGLTTPLYVVAQRGYDTHSTQGPYTANGVPQEGNHSILLRALSQGIDGFFKDLKALGVADRVLLMTVSEFGRRVNENGTNGTDHGTCAPQFFVSTQLNGGVYGHDPDLANLDNNGDLKHQYDFKQLYSSVLMQWFGVKQSDTALILKGEWETLPLFKAAPVSAESAGTAKNFGLEQNYPNPVSAALNGSTMIRFHTPGGRTSLRVYNVQGKEVATLADNTFAPGSHEIMFRPNGLAAGTYIYRLEGRGLKESRSMVVTR